jgi:acyl-CoA reductase-like NAD-dependent aldehyde dehydrogenase
MTAIDADLRSRAEARRAVEAAHEAQQRFLGTDPAHIDRIVEAMARAVEVEAATLGALAAEETGYGNAEDKRIKNLFNSIGVAEWLRNVKTLGVLWSDPVTKVMAIGEPMGVVAALIPVTNPTSTVIFKVLSAVKSGNAVVCAPHPRGVRCGAATVEVMMTAAGELGAPDHLIQCLTEVTIEGTQELMRHRRTAVVMATGGSAMVREAYSSGKPTLAVGPGNVPVYVHASMGDSLTEVADQILTSKSFDYGTACASEQAVVVDRPVAGMLEQEIRRLGGYFCTAAEADRLAGVIFDENQGIRPGSVGQSAAVLAQRAGFGIPPRTRVLLARETEVGRRRPLSLEKLNPVLAWYEVAGVEQGYDLCLQVLRFGGRGHTLAVHTRDPEVVSVFGRLPAGRVLVNQPALHGAMGYSADLEPSFMLGTGTVSGSIVSDNVTALHLINIKRVAYESRPWRSIYDVYGS